MSTLRCPACDGDMEMEFESIGEYYAKWSVTCPDCGLAISKRAKREDYSDDDALALFSSLRICDPQELTAVALAVSAKYDALVRAAAQASELWWAEEDGPDSLYHMKKAMEALRDTLQEVEHGPAQTD